MLNPGHEVNNLPGLVLPFQELFGCKLCATTEEELGYRGCGDALAQGTQPQLKCFEVAFANVIFMSRNLE